MVRSSREVTAQHKDRILDVAAQKVKQQGVNGVTIPDVMQAAGMTQGGFYTHFASKDDLTAQAMRHAFEKQRDLLKQLSSAWEGNHRGASDALAGMYVSRVDPERIGLGCPISALVGDVARSPVDSPLRSVWAEQLNQNVSIMAALGGELDGEVTPEQRARALVRLATLIGTAVLSRATSGDPLETELRAAVLASLTSPE